MKYWSVITQSGSRCKHPRGVNIQVEPDQPVTPPKEPDEVIQSSDSDSDDSDIEVPVVRGRGSCALRPNPARTQVLNDIYV